MVDKQVTVAQSPLLVETVVDLILETDVCRIVKVPSVPVELLLLVLERVRETLTVVFLPHRALNIEPQVADQYRT